MRMAERRAERTFVVLTGLSIGLFAVASTASAQLTGTIRGRVMSAADRQPVDGAEVVATSPSAQGEQFVLTDDQGRFSIGRLPPGLYTLAFKMEGFRDETVGNVTVELGQTTPVTIQLVPTELQAADIVVTQSAPVVDRGATESGVTLNRDLTYNVPAGRQFTAVLRETPGASSDQRGTTVYGSTGVENTYIIEGLNTTDVGSGEVGTNLPIDFFDSIEVKTGGYLPEYGRSTGGIFNLVLRSGGNDFHGDVFLNIAPGFLQAAATPIYRAGESIGRRDELLLRMDVGAAVGGPIIRDRLWFFVGFNPQLSLNRVSRIIQTRFDEATQDDNGNVTANAPDGRPDFDANGNPRVRALSTQNLHRNNTIYQFASKLTLGLDADHRLSLSYFGNPGESSGVLRGLSSTSTINGVSGSPAYYNAEREFGAHNVILGYDGQLFERRMQIEGFTGVHTQRDEIPNQHNDTPLIALQYQNQLDAFEPGRCSSPDPMTTPDCVVRDYRTGGQGWWQNDRLTRYVAGFRLTHLLAGHRIRYGFDTELKNFSSTRGYSGGYFEDHRAPLADVDGDGVIDNYRAHRRRYFARENENDPNSPFLYGVDGNAPFSADVGTHTFSAFIQDQWELNDYVTLNGGLRWDMERLLDAEGTAQITIPDEFAPRLGVSVDPTGDGRARLFASYGWYFESIPMTINQRAFSQEGTTFTYHDDSGNPICFDENGVPVPGLAPPDCNYHRDGVLGGYNSPVVNNLKGQYHEEVMLGGEYEIFDGWVFGVTGIYRNLKRAIEDISPDDGNNYFIANPGVNDCDVPEEFRGPLMEACSTDGVYDPNKTLFPRPNRQYTGLVFMVRKRLSDHAQMLASYTLSRSWGDYPGLFNADTGQLDPNLSSQYDLLSLLPNRTGNLPNDQRHMIKFAGSYEFGGLTPSLRGLVLGMSYQGLSGTPTNFLGQHDLYGRQEVFILPRGSAGTTPFTHQVDSFVGYDVPLSNDGVVLNLNATIFNLFNFQEATSVDQEYTTDVILPCEREGGGECSRGDLASLANADGEAINVNPTFGSARTRQAPLYVRLGARLTF